MAQKLKEEARIAIIDAAKEEFLKKGYKNASMRSISTKANMTVGNLYRYFKNKEEINRVIVKEPFQEINQVLKELTSNKLSMEISVFNVKADINELNLIMDQLAEKLVDIYESKKKEFNILMMNSKLNQEMIEWFSNAIHSLINQHFLLEGFSSEKKILSRCYAVSIFAGMKEIFRISSLEKEKLKSVVKIYLRSYLVLLDSDLRKLVS